MQHTTDGASQFMGIASHFVEAILCEKRLRKSPPRELTFLRVKAAFAKQASTAERILSEAAIFADKLDSSFWTEALRSHFELAEFHCKNGNAEACAENLKLSLDLLKRHFSSGNYPMAQMHKARAACLKACGCELGSIHEEELAKRMERGGRD